MIKCIGIITRVFNGIHYPLAGAQTGMFPTGAADFHVVTPSWRALSRFNSCRGTATVKHVLTTAKSDKSQCQKPACL